MKKILFVLLIALLVIGLIACGKSIGEKAVENMIEGIMENEGIDIDVNIDDDGDTVTFETEEGEVTVESNEGGMAWPSDKLPAGFPVLNSATIVSVIDVGTGILIGFEGCTPNAADAFISNFSTGDWKTQTMESAGIKIFVASKDNGEVIQFSWNPDEGEGNITYATD